MNAGAPVSQRGGYPPLPRQEESPLPDRGCVSPLPGRGIWQRMAGLVGCRDGCGVEQSTDSL